MNDSALSTTAKYYDGATCAECRSAIRYTIGGQCVACRREYGRELARAKAKQPAAIARRLLAKANAQTIATHAARLAAIDAGERVWHGRPCRYGHTAGRFACDSNLCVECHAIRTGKSVQHYLGKANA